MLGLLLLLLFIVVPLAELYLLLALVGPAIGAGPTIAIVIGTGMLGAALVRGAGVRALRDIQRAVAEGRLPTDELLGGMCALVGAAFLITPGILTDIGGMLLLIPPTQALAVALLKRALRDHMQVTFQAQGQRLDVRGDAMFGGIPRPPEDQIKDVEIRDVDR